MAIADLELFVSCLAGCEAALAEELHSLGVHRVRPLSGGVAVYCHQKQALKICLWSRLAARVLLVLDRVDATSAETLYAQSKALPWGAIIASESTLALRAHGTNDQLRNTKFTALKVKDAICDALRETAGWRPDIDTTEPDVSIEVRIKDTKATISLDLSGETLFQRSYLSPTDASDEAHRCGEAASLLALTRQASPESAQWAIVDPACESGAVVLEAAAFACRLAPGLIRDRWGFGGWAALDLALWQELLDEADEAFESGLAALQSRLSTTPENPEAEGPQVGFIGTSTSSVSIAIARTRAKRAGLGQVVSIELGDAESVDEVVTRAAGALGTPAVVASMEPLAEEGIEARVKAEERAILSAFRTAPEHSLLALAGYTSLYRSLSGDPLAKTELGRGRIAQPMRLYGECVPEQVTIVVADPHGGADHSVEVFDQTSEQFAARLKKNFKATRKWAAKEGVSCYRVYDADLPDYAVAIDLYTGADNAEGIQYLHIAEYAPPASIDPDKAARRFDDILSIAPIALGVRPDHVFSKTRQRAKGGSQYAREKRHSYVTHIMESNHLFEVDFSSYLDTGIFLDHRPTRQWIEYHSQNKRFLNLFAYTGTASVYAAAGGASETTTVDLSQTYLDWARRNMELNGFSGEDHSFERADVMQWIIQTRRTPLRYDLIFVDPPTFSNSKAMGTSTWDVQRDHVELLIGVSRLLTEGGCALFSCNLRSFKPDYEQLEKYGVTLEEVTEATIPFDFSRNQKIHHAYLVTRAH